MRQLPDITGFDDYYALIARTDYGDEETWRLVASALSLPWGVENFVFVADHLTMTTDHHALLVVTTLTPDDLGEEHYQWETKFGREYRTVPAEVQGIQANENIANMDFNEFAGAAHEAPDGVFRGFK